MKKSDRFIDMDVNIEFEGVILPEKIHYNNMDIFRLGQSNKTDLLANMPNDPSNPTPVYQHIYTSKHGELFEVLIATLPHSVVVKAIRSREAPEGAPKNSK